MRKSLVPPPVLLEQFNLRSGPIERPGFEKYGVVFSTHANATENDIDTSKVLFKTLLNTTLPGPDGEFTILGGYFCKRVKDSNGQNAVEISQVFGDALDAGKGFGLSGGNEMIGDNWELIANAPSEIRKKYVDERNFGESGWTFLTTFKAKRAYFPHSSNEIHIVQDCPTVKITHYVMRYPNDEEVEVTANARVEGGTVNELHWNFGDSDKIIKTKEPKAKHTYKRPFGDDDRFTITLTSVGPDDCGDEHKVPIKIPGREHPGLESVTEVNRKKSQDKKETTIEFEAKLEDPNNPHNSYTWDFGDNSQKVTIDGPAGLKATHTYTNGEDFLNRTVTVEGKGPETCESSVITEVRLDPSPLECPTIGEVKQIEKKDSGDRHTHFKLRVDVQGNKPNQFIWSWEDEGNEVIRVTDVPEISLLLTKTEEDKRPVIITVDTVGPGSCAGQSDICVHVDSIDTVACPWYMKAFPYAMALFFTMFVAAIIACYVGISMGKVAEGEAATDHLYTWTIVLAFLTIIGGFVWAVMAKNKPCGPSLCNILLIGATGLIGSAVFSALIGECFESYLPLFFIMLFLGIIAIIYYNMKCKGKHSITQIGIFVAMGVLAVILAVAFHAGPSLAC